LGDCPGTARETRAARRSRRGVETAVALNPSLLSGPDGSLMGAKMQRKFAEGRVVLAMGLFGPHLAGTDADIEATYPGSPGSDEQE
jgi:hypothetical protein